MVALKTEASSFVRDAHGGAISVDASLDAIARGAVPDQHVNNFDDSYAEKLTNGVTLSYLRYLFGKEVARPVTTAISANIAETSVAGLGQVVSSSPIREILVDPFMNHPAAGSTFIRHALHETALRRLDDLRCSLPLGAQEGGVRMLSSGRARGLVAKRYYDESQSTNPWVSEAIREVVQTVDGRRAVVLPKFRFIEYKEHEGMAAHTDGLIQHPLTQQRSTHTFMLYLTDCATGGETAILDSMKPGAAELVRVAPVRNSIVFFSHVAPHMGCTVSLGQPKIALRGDMYFESGHLCL